MTEHSTELLPWMQAHFDRLLGLQSAGKLAHAYLFGGQQGLGKLTLARHFAHTLLCTGKTDSNKSQPCGQCRECQLLLVGNHPDLKLIQPEDSSEIKIEQVREVIEFISKTSQRGGYKIVVISPAEAMNINSANAILKVLEEPSPNTLLMLVSHQPALLMATIRSRCHSVKFNRPAPEQVLPWLESKNVHASPAELLRMANNIPLRALQYADENAMHDRAVLHGVLENLLLGNMGIAAAASECEAYGLEENIEAMMLCASDILAHNQCLPGGMPGQLHDHDLKSLAVFFENRTTLKQLHEFYRELVKARRAVKSTTNPNRLLVLESLFYHWMTTVR